MGFIFLPSLCLLYVEKLFLEGAKWDIETNQLVECKQTEIMSHLPVVHLLPTTEDVNDGYECPIFRTQTRGTGAVGLPNYIISLDMPISQKSKDHWIQRSVACIITVHK